MKSFTEIQFWLCKAGVVLNGNPRFKRFSAQPAELFSWRFSHVTLTSRSNLVCGQSWEGCPTTQFLRHAGIGNPVLRERWHKCLSKLLGQPRPTAEQEAADPTAAHHAYSAGVKLLINKTRETKKFHLLYNVNVQYGYSRNLYATRIMGIILSSLGVGASVAAGWLNVHNDTPKMYPWVCLAAEALFLIWWLVTITANWVKVPAFAYAERLLETTENLSPSIETPTRSE